MMKKVKKIFTFFIAAVMMMSMGTTVFAQDVPSNAGGSATITISNASKGETYKVYKLFDASVTGNVDGSIAYTGEIPKDLSTYFTKDGAENIRATEAAQTADGSMSDGLKEALADWVKTAAPVASAESDGSTLVFKNLAFGYYVVTTTQGKQAITVTSTNPNAEIVDKNSTTPVDLVKKVDKVDISIGDTVTYTARFKTSNYDGAGEVAKKIASYTISDTLPEFLTDVKVTSITIGGTPYMEGKVPQFDAKKTITIPWVDGNKKSLYKNGAEIVVTYTAKVTNQASVGGDDDHEGTGNTNIVTVTWKTTDGGPGSDKLEDKETIYTYAAAIQKVDENDKNLPGAKFSIKGLTVTGSKGNYTVVSYDPSAGAEAGTEMEGDDNGLIVIMGITSETTLIATETKAPSGYNKLTESFEVTPKKMSETTVTTSKTTYYDEDGKIIYEEEKAASSTTVVEGAANVTKVKVENKKGALLPSTGGMGTTIFYVIGTILVIGAGVLLVVRRRMRSEK